MNRTLGIAALLLSLVASPALAAEPCQPGTYSETGEEPCGPCAPDTFAENAGSSACTPCEAGTRAAAGSTACIDPCDPDPCLNGGECIDTAGPGYVCSCLAGYTGINCETSETTTTITVETTTSTTETTTSTTESTTSTTESTTSTTESTTSTTESTTSTTESTTSTTESTTSTTESTTSTTESTTSTTESTTSTTETTSTTTATASSTTTTTMPAICGHVPATGCRLAGPGASMLRIRDGQDSTKDELNWKWRKGAATDLGDFADPPHSSATYRLCVYDASSAAQPLLQANVPPAGTCGNASCWKTAGSKGFRYKNPLGLPHGVTDVKLKAGAAGTARVLAKGKGMHLPLPGLQLSLPVTVQLVIDDGISRRCWQSTYAFARSNDASGFEAKGP